MGSFDDPIGSILIITWISSMLEMLIIGDTFYYYMNFKKDRLIMKIFVGSVVFVDFLSLITNYALVYLLTVSFWGQPAALQKQLWPIPSFITTTAVTTFLVQSFLIHRVWAMTKNWLYPIILGTTALLSFGGCLTAAVFFGRLKLVSDRSQARIPAIFWLAPAAATDVGITLALLARLYAMKTTFNQTGSIIQRLIRTSIQTGSATSVVAIIALLTYLINYESDIGLAFAFVLGRLYVLTLLFNINLRTSNRDQPTSRGDTVSTPAVIHVHQTAHVHMDEEYALDTRKNVNSGTDDSDRESVLKV